VIRRIEIRNFQSHRKLVLEFDPHVTTIIGDSDQGKSAILRALRWVATNKPKGNEFIHHDSKFSRVTIQVDEHRVTRKRSLSKNTYTLNDNEFSAIGHDVPKEIASVLNVTELNFQDQHDSPFWFSLSAPEVSRRLNEIVDLSIIDHTLTNIASEIRKTNAEKEVVQKRLDLAVAERTRLKWVDKAHLELENIERLASKQKHCEGQVNQLQELVSASQTLMEYIRKLKDWKRDATPLIKLGEEWGRGCKVEQELNGLVKQIRNFSHLADIELPSTEELDKTVQSIKQKQKRVDELTALVYDIHQNQLDAQSHKRAAQEAKAQLKKEMGDVCALCGQEIPS
jgi:DNA repair protein SbcC/Rad50